MRSSRITSVGFDQDGTSPRRIVRFRLEGGCEVAGIEILERATPEWGEPTLGTIEMDGQILSSPSGSVSPDRRQMSMIFQSYAIWPNMTVEQNVAFGLELRKIPKAEVRRRVGEMLEVVQS